VLFPRVLDGLVAQHVERAGDPPPGVARANHFVDIAALGGDERVGETVLIFLDCFPNASIYLHKWPGILVDTAMERMKRRLLTPEFVDAIAIPEDGETWIADTKVRGFGVRAWAGKRGGGKAYAIRVAGVGGRMVRLTYPLPQRHQPSNALGILLEDARSWGRDEVDFLKGRRTLRQELEENQRPVKRDISKRGLGELASAKLQGMRLLGASQSYVDNLEKLFFNSIPENLLCRPIKAVSARKLAGALKQLDDKPGQARALRAMMGQILKSAAEFEPSAWRLLGLTQKLYTPDYEGRRQRKVDLRYSEGFFEKLFSRLESEERDWQQAYFIRLLFEFNVPARRLLNAQWRTFIDNLWFPWLPSERKYWHLHGQRIEGDASRLLAQLKIRNEVDFPGNPFLFPSRKSVSGHMTSFRPYWQRVAAETGVKPEKLRTLVSTYQRRVVFPRVFERVMPRFAASE
jgi:hypothetical protein